MFKFLKLSLLALIIPTDKFKERPVSMTRSFESLQANCPSYTLVYGNLSTASTIFFAENHSRRKETIQCIERLTSNDLAHFVLFEGAPQGIVGDCETLLDNKNTQATLKSKTSRICAGWDDIDAAREISHKLQLSPKYPLSSDPNTHKYRLSILEEIVHLNFKRNHALSLMLFRKTKETLALTIIGKGHLFYSIFRGYNVHDIGFSKFLKFILEEDKDRNPYAILAMDTASDTPVFFSNKY